jgi:hypothetical protein
VDEIEHRANAFPDQSEKLVKKDILTLVIDMRVKRCGREVRLIVPADSEAWHARENRSSIDQSNHPCSSMAREDK